MLTVIYQSSNTKTIFRNISFLYEQTQKCKTKPHPNDKYNVIDGRVYLKSKSPFEGVWHETHIPYDIHEVKKIKPI